MSIKRINGILLILLSCAICTGIIVYTMMLSSLLKVEEEKNMNRWAMATKMLTVPNDNGNTDFTLALQTVQDNTTIPVVVTDSAGNIITYRNLSDEELSEEQMLSILQHMQTDGNKIEIPLEAGENQYLYYLDSQLIDRLAYMPVVILGLVVLFVLFAYVVFSKASKSEQNMVWIGLARESAHQLGTPISALEGWKELLESTDIDRCEVAKGIGDDVKRLGNIAERFSKIGSRTEYDSEDIVSTIYKTYDYLHTRVPRGVILSIENRFDGVNIKTPHNTVLMSWVIENLCRNSIDAMDGKGELSVRIFEDSGRLAIDVSDTGKGIPRGLVRQIFKTGFTTKKRGWGIGLSLAKRIVEQYHKGKISVKWSEVGKGTIMRVTLGKISR